MNYYLVPIALVAGFILGYVVCSERTGVTLKSNEILDLKNVGTFIARTPDGKVFLVVNCKDGTYKPVENKSKQ